MLATEIKNLSLIHISFLLTPFYYKGNTFSTEKYYLLFLYFALAMGMNATL